MPLTFENFDGWTALDAVQLRQAVRGTGWLSGNAASLVDTDAAIRIDVTSGDIVVRNSTVTANQNTIDLDPGDAVDYRKDIVYRDDTGALGVAEGTPRRIAGEVSTPTDRETYSPQPSDLATLDGMTAWDEVVPVAEVWVPPDATGASDLAEPIVDYIRDRRARPWPDYVVSNSDAVAAHSGTHENGGSDELDVTGLSGALADPQDPTTHATSHQDGGSDELDVAGLAGGDGTAGQVAQTDGAAVSWVTLPHDDLTSIGPSDHHQEPSAGTGITDEGTNQFGLNVVASGDATLSAESAVIDTGHPINDTNTYQVGLNPDDGADIAASLEEGGTNYQLHLEENTTSVGNPGCKWSLVEL